MNSDSAVTSLAGLRVVIGILALVAPRFAGKLFGLQPEANPQSPYLARLFGIRDVALGLGALSTKGEARRQWVTIGIGVDATDALSAGLAKRDGSVSGFTAAKLAAPALAAVALGAMAASSNGSEAA